MTFLCVADTTWSIFQYAVFDIARANRRKLLVSSSHRQFLHRVVYLSCPHTLDLLHIASIFHYLRYHTHVLSAPSMPVSIMSGQSSA